MRRARNAPAQNPTDVGERSDRIRHPIDLPTSDG
jgi:hypothetical protein